MHSRSMLVRVLSAAMHGRASCMADQQVGMHFHQASTAPHMTTQEPLGGGLTKQAMYVRARAGSQVCAISKASRP